MSACAVATPASLRERERVIDPDEAADHLTRLYRLAWSLCGSAELAEDLVQETYARLLARPRRLRGGDEFSYLARILRNVLYDHLRRRRRCVDSAEAPDEDTGPVDQRSEGDPEAAILARELYTLVAGLPEPQREVIAAVDVAGLSYRETARLLHVPIGTVMSRLSRARARLAELLGDDWD